MDVPMPLRFRTRIFAIPKPDERESDDAVSADDGKGICALADGATCSGFGGIWAMCLVEEACRAGVPIGHDIGQWLDAPLRRWHEATNNHAGQEPDWYQVHRDGAATFLAVQLAPERATCSLHAVGDTCAFMVRDGRLERAFPLERSLDFNSFPGCIPTSAAGVQPLAEVELKLEAGDTIFLATDALAKWMLEQSEGNAPPWRRLQALVTQRDFQEFVDAERAARRLDPDDVSLVVVDVQLAPGAPALVPEPGPDQAARCSGVSRHGECGPGAVHDERSREDAASVEGAGSTRNREQGPNSSNARRVTASRPRLEVIITSSLVAALVSLIVHTVANSADLEQPEGGRGPETPTPVTTAGSVPAAMEDLEIWIRYGARGPKLIVHLDGDVQTFSGEGAEPTGHIVQSGEYEVDSIRAAVDEDEPVWLRIRVHEGAMRRSP